MAQIVIDLTAAQTQRIAPALGKAMGLPGDATIADAKAYLTEALRKVVLDYERRKRIEDATTAPDIGFDPT